MTSLEPILTLLVNALLHPELRVQLIQAFQKSVWQPSEISENDRVEEILKDLALDLDYYVLDPDKRREDPSYYGDERVEEEIRSSLKKLERQGVAIPFEH